MRILFIILSIFFVICGIFSAMGEVSSPTMTIGLLAIGMAGIGVVAFTKR